MVRPDASSSRRVLTGPHAPQPGRRRWRPRPVERRVLLLLGDLLAAWIAWLLATLLWWSMEQNVTAIPLGWWAFVTGRPLWFFFLPFLWLLLLVDLYEDRRAASWEDTRRGLLGVLVVALVLYLALYFYLVSWRGPRLLPRVSVAAFLALAGSLTALWRRVYLRVLLPRFFVRRAIIIGAGPPGRALWQWLQQSISHPFQVLGFVDDVLAPKDRKDELPLLGDARQLPELVSYLAVTDVLVALQGPIPGSLFQALLDVQAMGVEVSHMNAIYEELFQRVPIEHLDATWMLRSFMDEARKTAYYEAAKRVLDILGALVGLALLTLMFPIIALWIYLESGRPILFVQERVGRHGERFRVRKFRTMLPDIQRERGRWASEDEHRITRFGRFLRKTHLDEFPQFWDVLRGKMSLVGPRPEQPELVQKLEQRIPFYRARLLVKPGLTGWAQVNMGYVGSLEETRIKLEYDLYYIKHRNLLFDLYIILRTFGAVFGARGG